jgi:tetratricopeptide (TPR) repeat protein
LRWLGVAFLVFGGGYALVNLAAMLETGWSVPRAFERGDRARLETAARRLHWIGRDSKDTFLQIANLASSAGDIAGARAAVSRSLEITPSAIGYVNLGMFDADEDRLSSAQLAFERALALEPGMLEATYRLGLLQWRRGNRLESLRLLEEAAQAAPERADIRAALEKARAARDSGPGDAGRRARGVAPSPSRPRAGPPRP